VASRQMRYSAIPIAVMLILASACTTSTSKQESSPGGGGGATDTLNDAYSERLAAAAEVTVDTSEFAKSAPYTAATIVQGRINGWGTIFDLVLHKAMADSGKFDMSETLYGAWNGQIENQTKAMGDAIAAKVDVIILNAMSSSALSASVDRATEAGIPVVLCMAGVDSDNYTTQVNVNTVEMGYETAKALAEKLGGEGKVVMLNGIAGVDAAEHWSSGAKSAFAAYPGIEVVAEPYANWSPVDATDVMRTVVAQHPDIDGVWIGGLEMTPGVITAFQERGLKVPFISGTNPSNGFLRLAQENDLDFYAAPLSPNAAKECANVAAQVLEGKSVKKYVNVETFMPDAAPFGTSDIAKYYLPGLNDDFIGPPVYPESFYADSGFKRE
jgi:ribose transport system substrate-binding protein